jgi:hypothetical protein
VERVCRCSLGHRQTSALIAIAPVKGKARLIHVKDSFFHSLFDAKLSGPAGCRCKSIADQECLPGVEPKCCQVLIGSPADDAILGTFYCLALISAVISRITRFNNPVASIVPMSKVFISIGTNFSCVFSPAHAFIWFIGTRLESAWHKIFMSQNTAFRSHLHGR